MHARAKNLWSLYAPGIHIGRFEHSYLSNIPSQLIVPERGTTFVKIDCQPSSLQMFLSTIPERHVRVNLVYSSLVAFEPANFHSRKLIFRSIIVDRSFDLFTSDLEEKLAETSVKIFVEKFRFES